MNGDGARDAAFDKMTELEQKLDRLRARKNPPVNEMEEVKEQLRTARQAYREMRDG